MTLKIAMLVVALVVAVLPIALVDTSARPLHSDCRVGPCACGSSLLETEPMRIEMTVPCSWAADRRKTD